MLLNRQTPDLCITLAASVNNVVDAGCKHNA